MGPGMTSTRLRSARKAAGLTQQQAAGRLGISQAYLALLESGRRRLTDELARKAARLYRLPPTELPLEEHPPDAAPDAATVARDLASLGYPAFAYLRPGRRKNPASVLLAALSSDELETRLAEALPWLILQFPELDWDWLLAEAKQREIQNRLGFVVSLARRLSERRFGSHSKQGRLEEVEAGLDRIRLVREDTLCQQSLSEAERRWLRDSRPNAARHWNLLTDLALEHLPYAA